MITTVQCSIRSQLNNKHRVVVTDFRLHHTCSIIILWLHSLSGVIRSLLYNPLAFSNNNYYKRVCEHAHLIHVHVHQLYNYAYLYCGYAHEGGKQMYRNF